MEDVRNSEDKKSDFRSTEIQHQIQALSGRDLQLWSISILVILVLLLGFLAMVLPNMAWHPATGRVEERYLPQFFFGLISLVVLFNVYVISQKRSLNATRLELIRELVIHEKLDSVSLVDPVTQVFNAHSIEMVMSREVSRSNRMGSSLTFLVVSLDSYKAVVDRGGDRSGDQLLGEFARLVKDNFRGSDTVLRYRHAALLVVLPETTEEQAECAVARLLANVDHWNIATKTGWEMSVSYGISPYVTGAEVKDVIRSAERKLCLKQQKLVPVFPPVSGNSGTPLPV